MRVVFTEKNFYLEDGGALSGEMQAWREEFSRSQKKLALTAAVLFFERNGGF